MSKRDKEMSRPTEDERRDETSNTSQADIDREEAEDSSVEVQFKSEGDTSSEEIEDTASDEVAEEVSEDEAVEAEIESERFLRLAAEFDNYKKRTAREFEDIIKRANVRLLRELMDIVDNFERAMSAESEDHSHKAYRQGVELIYNQLSALLTKEGVTPIEAVGKPFDPHYHEAVMQAASDEYDEGTVMQEIQKGYRIGDKVLRHSRVIVSSGSSKGENEQERDDE
jgi:molecular chaperone GrpE